MKQKILYVLASLFFLSCSNKNSGQGNENPSVALSQRIEATKTTANTNTNCTAIQPFYYEIGDGSAVLASGSTGNGSVLRTTNMSIASSSKWMFGAYVVQRLNGALDATNKKFLQMSAGYTSFGNFSCAASNTVADCYNAGTNSTYTFANDNQFYYNGGHFQRWAMDHGMGSLTKAQLVSEYQSQLGSDLTFTFTNPQMAGGVNTNAANYALFLQKLINNQLVLSNLLGADKVCTNPNTCATALNSPIVDNWHYSYGHWVEDDTTNGGDNSFSSAGLFGFYPWIDSTKKYYGIVARYDVPAPGNDIGSGWASYLCGRLIRKAFMTGAAQ